MCRSHSAHTSCLIETVYSLLTVLSIKSTALNLDAYNLSVCILPTSPVLLFQPHGPVCCSSNSTALFSSEVFCCCCSLCLVFSYHKIFPEGHSVKLTPHKGPPPLPWPSQSHHAVIFSPWHSSLSRIILLICYVFICCFPSSLECKCHQNRIFFFFSGLLGIPHA